MQDTQPFFQSVDALLQAVKIRKDFLLEEYPNVGFHRFDRFIMSCWGEIRQKALDRGLFGPNDSQEILYAKLAEGVTFEGLDVSENPLEQVQRRFVLGDVTPEDRDAYERHSFEHFGLHIGERPSWYVPINVLEFWLVLKEYVSNVQELNAQFTDFAGLLQKSLNLENEDLPNKAGWIVKPFGHLSLAYNEASPVYPKSLQLVQEEKVVVKLDNKQEKPTATLSLKWTKPRKVVAGVAADVLLAAIAGGVAWWLSEDILTTALAGSMTLVIAAIAIAIFLYRNFKAVEVNDESLTTNLLPEKT